MSRPDAPGASASLRRLEALLRRQQEAIRKRRPERLLETTEALEAEMTRWVTASGARDQGGAVASPQEVAAVTDRAQVAPQWSDADRRRLQRVRSLQQANQALLEQEAAWVHFMLEHLRPGLQTYSGDGRLQQAEPRVIIDRHV
ncbi:flagellar export chaperone FlgN [Limnochorda pilosa]|uniref:Flagellar protein FlgN n=1 Tax=Limnochorda pilosa TaxID=1555112 RepID=A0A0K2SPP9_LIMPI|nr:flagellar export chaperone FlgN [Limnochorda pilosa]BAS28799.1 hypothetical protein LIP_2970 [Limnochorda pilosa]